ncbi:hypothetical protein ACLBXM_17040 [Xanthobacteraceae bacterium A53D]
MLPTPLLNRYYDLVRTKRAQFDDELAVEMNLADRRAAAVGMLSSGNALAATIEVSARSLVARCKFAEVSLDRAFEAFAMKLTSDVLEDFKSTLAHEANESCVAIKRLMMNSAAFRANMGNSAYQAGMKRIEDLLKREIASMNAEADLRAEAEARAQSPHAPISIIVHGNGNAVTIGDRNEVAAAATIDQVGAKALSEALRSLIVSLDSLSPGSIANAAEVREVAESLQSEVTGPNPNRLKTKAYLVAVAEAIKFVPAVKASYEALKAGASLIGFDLD